MTEVGDEGFRAIFDQIVIPILERFRPDMILVSAGYDAHWDDPLAGLGLSLSGMAWVSQTLVEAAEGLCDGRIVFALEGGYNLRVLGVAAANTFRALLGRRDYSDALGKSPYREPDLAEYLARAKKVHGLA
jgi:acetoin utilization deacetylase AcuC-like enzyme